MMIYVNEPGRFTGDELKPGKWYEVQDAAEGTEAQNRAFHALLQEYFTSGLFSYQAKSVDELKRHIKHVYGAGVEYWIAVVQSKTYPDAGHYRKTKCKTEQEAKGIATNFGTGNGAEQIIIPILKSWSKYTKAERMGTMDGLISEMLQAGCNSKKFEEILEGMEKIK